MKRDVAREYTDRKLKKLEKELGRVYSRALSQTKKDWGKFANSISEKSKPYLNEIERLKELGDRTQLEKAQKAYQAFLKQNTLQNKHYKRVVEKLSSDLADIDGAAYRLANNILPDIYAINYNSLLDTMPRGYSFNLVDAKTVKNLATKDVNSLKAAKWNRKRINAQVLQGILQGESVDKMADRFMSLVDGNRAAAVRAARTAVTSAENGGRLDSMKDAERLGLIYKKEWVATHDDRTRESHAEIDGETVELDEPFSNGLDYPADPKGEPEEVYNCRCTMNRVLWGIEQADGSIKRV